MNLPVIHLPSDYQPAKSQLAKRVILVTGAGQGLGRVAAKAFAAAGATVVLHGRNVAKLESVYDEIESAGGAQPAILPLDFAKTSQPEIDAFAQAIHAATGRLDGIFHAASAFVSTMPLHLQDYSMWTTQCAVNLAVPACITKACLPMLRRSADASVVFLSETHAVLPKAYWGAFAVTRSSLDALVAVWSDESEQTCLRFNLCLPSAVASPMRARSHPGETAASLMQPEDLAAHFVYLIGPDSAPITGALLDCQPAISGVAAATAAVAN
jgi:NAD(P)-dependent dehydrogenase (short-subunit alcohol dehydrogenase family)